MEDVLSLYWQQTLATANQSRSENKEASQWNVIEYVYCIKQGKLEIIAISYKEMCLCRKFIFKTIWNFTIFNLSSSHSSSSFSYVPHIVVFCFLGPPLQLFLRLTSCIFHISLGFSNQLLTEPFACCCSCIDMRSPSEISPYTAKYNCITICAIMVLHQTAKIHWTWKLTSRAGSSSCGE